MFLRTNSAKKMFQCAQQIFPMHMFDQHSVQTKNLPNQQLFITDKQKSLLDIVLKNDGNQSYVSLLNLFLNNQNQNFGLNALSSTDKELLLKTWKESQIKDSGTDKSIIVSDTISDKDLNLLKAKGLVTGMGRSVSFTPTGRQVLVEMILNTKSSLRSQAHNATRFIKMCQKMGYPEGQPDPSIEKIKIVRTKDGKWVAKKEDTQQDQQSGQQNIDLQTKTDEELEAMHNQLVKAQNDCFKYRKAGSTAWDEKYDLGKLQALKASIEAELRRRKHAKA